MSGKCLISVRLVSDSDIMSGIGVFSGHHVWLRHSVDTIQTLSRHLFQGRLCDETK